MQIKKWSQEESDLLIKYVSSSISFDEIGRLLKRSVKSCQRQCSKLKIKNSFKAKADTEWTNEQVEYLKNNIANKTYEEIAYFLNKTRNNVYRKSKRLGITIKLLSPKWSDHEIDVLREKSKDGKLSYLEIGKLIGRTGPASFAQAQKNKITNRHFSKKYIVNEKFFEPSAISAYWAGFLAADCYIKKSHKTVYQIRLTLQRLDKEHVERFKQDIGYSGVIYDRERLDKRTNKIYKSSSIVVTCNKWETDLGLYYGVTPDKSLNLDGPRRLSEFLQFAFALGFLDGDGNCSCLKNSKGLQISAVSLSFKVIEWLHNLVAKYFKTKDTSHWKIRTQTTQKGKLLYVFRVTGARAASFLDFLSRFDVPKLSRKWNKRDVLDYVEKQKLKYPERFINNEQLYNDLRETCGNCSDLAIFGVKQENGYSALCDSGGYVAESKNNYNGSLF